ncbi:MAG TPA: hypothetical protein VF596_16340, partial [Pyrinomonadaceae bacterium]
MAKLVLTVNDDAGQVTGNNNNDLTAASYAFNTNSAGYDHVGFRFTGVTVPQASTVHKATLKVRLSTISASSGTFDIKVEASDNAAALTTTNNDLASRTYSATIETTRVHDLANGTYYLDVTSLVQEIVNRAGWASGNALHLSFQAPWSSGAFIVDTLESANDPQLAIAYGDATAWTTFGSNTGSYTNPTNATADDGVYATTVNLPTATHTFYNFGFSIPSGATIDDVLVKANLKAESFIDRAQWGMEVTKNAGTNWSTQKKSVQADTVDKDYFFGGDPDGWSITLNSTEVNDNTNFRVRLQNDFSNASRDSSLDYIAVKVIYTAATGATLTAAS